MRLRILPLLLIAAACSSLPAGCLDPTCERVEVVLEHAGARLVVRAEVADTQVERVQGLRGRTELAPDAGMLFLFDEVAERTFTMDGVGIPLDLLVLRAGRVAEVIEMTPCAAGSPDCRYPTVPTDAALEVPGGTARRAGIGAGASVSAAGLP